MIGGASGGIGNYLTTIFDSVENELILTYNSSKEKVFKTKNAKSTIFKCDFTKIEEVKNLFSKVDYLNVLINTMGHVENNLIYRMDEGEWDRVIASNLKTIFLSCKFAFSKLVDNGHIINISSILGSMGMVGATNYVAAKGGVEAFTKSFALECLHKKRVFVNAIALGYFKIGLGVKLDDKIADMIREKIPLKAFGEIDEIGNVVKYIISSRYLVGQIIHLNGGLRI